MSFFMRASTIAYLLLGETADWMHEVRFTDMHHIDSRSGMSTVT